MLLFRKLFVVLLAITFLLVGCAKKVETKALPNPSEEMVKRGELFNASLGAASIKGVMLYSQGLEYFSSHANSFVDRVASLGLNRLYVKFNSVNALKKKTLEQFISLARAAKYRNIQCEIVLLHSEFVKYSSGSVLFRHFWKRDVMAIALEKIVNFEAETENVDGLISGVTIAPEYHSFTLTNVDLPANTIYLWSDKSYGKGQDNDILMGETMALLKRCKNILKGIELTVVVPAFYHDRAVAGDLSQGKITDFLAIADRVIVMGEGDKPSVFRDSFTKELVAAKNSPQRVVMGLQFASHSVGEKGKLRRRDWSDFIKISKYLVSYGQKYPAFGGVVFAPWSTLELLWEN